MFTKNIHYIGLNFVSQEHLDPILFSFLNLLGLSHNQFVYVLAQLLVLAAGIAILLAVTRVKGSGYAGVWASCAMVAVLGVDPFQIKIHWFPWMLTGMILFLIRRSIASVVFVILFAGLWIWTAGALAPFGVLLAACSAILITLRMRSFTMVLAEGSRTYGGFSFLVFAFLLLAIILIPEYPMPAYPGDARLVADNVFRFLPHPILGDRLHPIPVYADVYYGMLALSAQNFALLLASVSIALGVSALLWKESVRSAFWQIALHAAIAFVFVFSMLFWSETRIGVQPFYLLTRIIPGLGFVFLPWLLLSFSIVYLSLVIFAHCSRRVICVSIVTVAMLIAVLQATGNVPLAQAHFAQFGAESERSPYVGVTWSPSAAVVATVGPWIAAPGVASQRDFANLRRLTTKSDYAIRRVDAAPNAAAARRAVDGNVFTSWGTGRAQVPGDFYYIEFEQAVSLARVALSIQETPNSYPCSMSVRAVDGQGSEHIVYYQDPWPGPVFWTVDGFPYFGDPRQVVLDFANSQAVKSLRFELLNARCGERGWSIGEIKLYDLPSRTNNR